MALEGGGGQVTRMTSDVTMRFGLIEKVTSCSWLMGALELMGGEGGWEGAGRGGGGGGGVTPDFYDDDAEQHYCSCVGRVLECDGHPGPLAPPRQFLTVQPQDLRGGGGGLSHRM